MDRQAGRQTDRQTETDRSRELYLSVAAHTVM